jgi:hypothetical protein
VCVQASDPVAASEVLKDGMGRGIAADAVTFTALISACARASDVDHAMQVPHNEKRGTGMREQRSTSQQADTSPRRRSLLKGWCLGWLGVLCPRAQPGTALWGATRCCEAAPLKGRRRVQVYGLARAVGIEPTSIMVNAVRSPG